MKYPNNMDAECIALCDALNAIPGIATTESCCGHGVHPYRIFFLCNSFASLKRLVESLYHHLWRVEAQHWNGGDHLGFMLEGPKLNAEGRDIPGDWLAEAVKALTS